MLSFKGTVSLSLLLVWLFASQAFGQGEDNPRVEQLYNQAKQAQNQGDLASAISKYEEILRLAPKLGIAYNNLGALYFRQRNFVKAAMVLEQGLKVNPGMASAQALLGISCYEVAEYGRARTSLEAAVKANGSDLNAQMYLVKDLIALDDANAAEAMLQKMALRQPKNQEVFYLLAKVHMRLSEQALAQMNDIDPNSVLAHQLSAEVMESMNNYDGAVVQLKKAVALAPALPGNHYKLGHAYWDLSQWDLAMEEFKAEVAVDPGKCKAHWRIGAVILQKNGAPDEALAEIDKALSECPTLSDAHVDRARALAKLDRNQEAAVDLEAAAKATPADPSVHFLLAKIYRALGRSGEASQQMQLFSKLDEAARAATAERAQEVIQNKQSAH
jgi:tetratricopeptide (TPR) repeat protein